MSKETDLFAFLNPDDETLLIPAPRLSHNLSLGLDWATHTYYMHGAIEDSDGESFWQVSDQWKDHQIKLHLSTPGGDVDAMFSIHDAIRRHGNVEVTAYGQVCSAGVLILACGQRRRVAESLILMSHESVASQGELGYRAAKDRRKADDFQHVYWAELMARYTPQDADWWRRKTERQAEFWLLGGKDIVEAGLADEVL